MTRSELVAELSSAYPHLLLRDVERIVQIVLNEIASALERGDRVELRGFGAFMAKPRAARVGRNPRTGIAVDVEQKNVPVFRAGKDLRRRINAGVSLHDATAADQKV